MEQELVSFRTALRVLREAGYSYGRVTRSDITAAVNDKEWQKFRESMKGESTEEKIFMLVEWQVNHFGEHQAWVQITNYLNALKRGGQLK